MLAVTELLAITGLLQGRWHQSLSTTLVYYLSFPAFPPSFAKHSLQPNQYGTESGSTTIMCRPEAAPAAEIIWLKDGRQLSVGEESGSRLQKLPNGNLRISNLRQSDGGTYTCKAVNQLGEAESSGNLTILCEYRVQFLEES